jgi:hypothetical protein
MHISICICTVFLKKESLNAMAITSEDCLAMEQIEEEEHQLLLQTEVQCSECIQQNSTIGIDLRDNLKKLIQKEGMKTVTFRDFTTAVTKSYFRLCCLS